MSSAPHGRAFAARLFESPAIKSWREADAPLVRRALVAAIDAIRDGRPLVLDLLVEFEAEDLEPSVAASNVLLWRSRRSHTLGARVRRSLGIYSGESTLGAAVQVESGAELDLLLRGTTLWDSEFAIYPPPAMPLSDLPDPHFEIPGFAAAVDWTLNQDAGSDSWLITARGRLGLDMVCATLARAFEQQGLATHTVEAPPQVYGPTEPRPE